LAAIDWPFNVPLTLLAVFALMPLSVFVVTLLFVVEFVPVEPMSDALVPVVQIDDRLVARTKEQIVGLASSLGLSADCCRVATGNVKAEILRQAREVGADLIVLGCRERHGLSILVNLTEDTVLHGAPCDVLAMRVR